ncbi:MAG: DUF1512 domain-containing protein [Thaumarchaeota archaeon]|nr:DUF1512 domain-containing protein [Nitrososphaerota archaeon]
MDFTDFDFGELFSFGDEGPLMMLVWIIPIIIFVFYGQRIQLQITSGEIKKGIKKLAAYRVEARDELIEYIKKTANPKNDPTKKIDKFLDYFTIMPVDVDPNGVMDKIRHMVRSREDYSRQHIKSLLPETTELELTKIHTLLEIATTLQMLHKIVNHLFLTAKKQNNYPLILPLQMLLPFVMEEAEAMKKAILAFKLGQPIGDGIGPMVVGKMMTSVKKETISFQTILGTTEFEGRKIFLLKAEGPGSSVGRPGDAIKAILEKDIIDAIIMIDAALKMEGEDSATISQGFGAAIGGIGTERFQIEEAATKNNIPIFSIVIKQSIKEAITLMSRDIAFQAEDVRTQIYEMIQDNTKPGQTVLIVGVGNTIGVPQ